MQQITSDYFMNDLIQDNSSSSFNLRSFTAMLGLAKLQRIDLKVQLRVVNEGTIICIIENPATAILHEIVESCHFNAEGTIIIGNVEIMAIKIPSLSKLSMIKKMRKCEI